MELSQLIDKIEPSMTIKLSSKAKEMKKSGLDVVNLTAGEPDFDTPLHICEAGKKAIDKGYTRYLTSSGIKELREAVARTTSKITGVDYNFKNVAITNGCKHAIFNTMMATCNAGDEIIIPKPYWVSYPYLTLLAKAKPVYIETKDTDYLIDPQRLKETISDKTKIILINTPSNPVGNVYSREHLERIWNVVEPFKNILILSDEIYDRIIFNGLKHNSISSFSDESRRRTIIVNGVSKTYAMTGWRVGWLVAEENIVNNAIKIQSHTTSCACSVSQKAALEALTGSQDCVDKMRNKYEKRMNIVKNLLKDIPEINTAPIEGAFFAWIDVSKYYFRSFKDLKITSSLEMTDYLLDKNLLAIIPGIAFGDDNAVRISYAASEMELHKGIERLHKGLSDLKSL